ncbi:MAG: hypothetical protein C5B49_10455, partial [Bdellovibrio sp.]
LLEQEFRAFGRRFQFLNPDAKDPARKSFKEASFFTPHGRGKGDLNFIEVYESMNLLLSGGRRTALAIYDEAQAAGLTIAGEQRDSFGRQYLKQAETKERVRTLFGRYFSTLPEMVKKFAMANQKRAADLQAIEQAKAALAQMAKGHDYGFVGMEWSKYFGDYKAAKKIAESSPTEDLLSILWRIAEDPSEAGRPKPEGSMSYGEIRIFSTIVYYLESLFQAYDNSPHDLVLNWTEIKDSQARVYRFLDELIQVEKKVGDWAYERYFKELYLSVDSYYPCLVAEQVKVPSATCLRSGPEGDRVFTVVDIAKVIEVLKSSMAKKNQAAVPPR